MVSGGKSLSQFIPFNRNVPSTLDVRMLGIPEQDM